jgi:hypothetical protein
MNHLCTMKLPSSRVQDAIIEAIAARRAACGDDGLEDLREGPESVIRYVLAHRRVPPDVLAQDVADVLVLIRCQQAALSHAMHGALRLARSPQVGMSWADIAPHAGLASAQGALQLFQRLDAEDAGGPRSELAWRQSRREARFVAEHRTEIEQAARLLAASQPPGGAALDAMREAVEDPQVSAATVMVWLRLAVKELAAAGNVAQADVPVQLVRAWERLGPKRRRRAAAPYV